MYIPIWQICSFESISNIKREKIVGFLWRYSLFCHPLYPARNFRERLYVLHALYHSVVSHSPWFSFGVVVILLLWLSTLLDSISLLMRLLLS